MICELCRKELNDDIEKINSLNFMVVHKNCKEKFDDVHELMKYYLKNNYNELKINKQIKNLVENNISIYKIYCSLYYWYCIRKGNPSESNGGIGIVQYIYPEAIDYFIEIGKAKNINKDIDYKLIKNPEKIKAKYNISKKKKRNVKLYELD